MCGARIRPTARPTDANVTCRAKTDVEDAEAIARETLADPELPAGKDAAPSPVSNQLDVLHDWRESLVLQRVRLLTEGGPVLVSLPLRLHE